MFFFTMYACYQLILNFITALSLSTSTWVNYGNQNTVEFVIVAVSRGVSTVVSQQRGNRISQHRDKYCCY